MIVPFAGHEFVTVIDEEESTFWWEREKALHKCHCGAEAIVRPLEVGNPDTSFEITTTAPDGKCLKKQV